MSDPAEKICIEREELEGMVRGLLACTEMSEVQDTAEWIMRRFLKVSKLTDRDRQDRDRE